MDVLASGSNLFGVFEARRCRVAASGGDDLGFWRTGDGEGERLA